MDLPRLLSCSSSWPGEALHVESSLPHVQRACSLPHPPIEYGFHDIKPPSAAAEPASLLLVPQTPHLTPPSVHASSPARCYHHDHPYHHHPDESPWQLPCAHSAQPAFTHDYTSISQHGCTVPSPFAASLNAKPHVLESTFIYQDDVDPDPIIDDDETKCSPTQIDHIPGTPSPPPSHQPDRRDETNHASLSEHRKRLKTEVSPPPPSRPRPRQVASISDSFVGPERHPPTPKAPTLSSLQKLRLQSRACARSRLASPVTMALQLVKGPRNAVPPSQFGALELLAGLEYASVVDATVIDSPRADKGTLELHREASRGCTQIPSTL